MGANKAFLELEGKSLLNRALDTLKAACGSVTLVGDPVVFANFGPVVADVFPNCGPLGGIHAALAASAVEFNVIVAVDMPFVSPKLIDFLFAAAEASDAIVTVPRTRTGFQPLCAVYRRAFASTAERALQEGRYKVDVGSPTLIEVFVRVARDQFLGQTIFGQTIFGRTIFNDLCSFAHARLRRLVPGHGR
jgi:molybdopterin-guanine dinucleotide biosynthesis protein A